MTEPVTTSATAVAGASTAALIYLFGPGAPEMLLVILASLIGALHPMGKKSFANALAAVRFVALWVGTAVILTGVAVWAIEHYFALPASRWPGVVAFAIAFLSDRWPVWIESTIDFVVRRKTTHTDAANERPGPSQ